MIIIIIIIIIIMIIIIIIITFKSFYDCFTCLILYPLSAHSNQEKVLDNVIKEIVHFVRLFQVLGFVLTGRKRKVMHQVNLYLWDLSIRKGKNQRGEHSSEDRDLLGSLHKTGLCEPSQNISLV